MNPRAVPIAFGTAAVALQAGVSLFASALNPPDASALLTIGSVGAVALMVEAVVSRPGALPVAVLLGSAPVVGLTLEGGPTALVVPFAALLLLAAELCALSWERPSGDPADVSRRWSRLREALTVAALGFAAGDAMMAVGRLELVRRLGGGGGTVALALGAAGLVLLALVLFGRRKTGSVGLRASRVVDQTAPPGW